MKHLLLIVFVLFGTIGCRNPNPGANHSRMNVILIITDDQPIGTMQYMENWTKELNKRGTIFTKAFVTSPLCCPSRASIFTGLYAHHTGVMRNSMPLGGARAFKDEQNIGLWLQQNGYTTGFIGKYLNAYEKISPHYPPGWDFFAGMVGPTQYNNMKTNVNGKEQTIKGYSPVRVFEKSVQFIKQNVTKPFFLVITPVTPHLPAIPEKQDADKFKDYHYVPISYEEHSVKDKPKYLRRINEHQPPSFLSQVAPQIIEADCQSRITQLQALQTVDRGITQIISTLKEEDIYNNTTIIFMSDNGYLFGEHRLRGKVSLYEEAIRVPAGISSPHISKGIVDSTNFFLNIDLAPTILSLCQAQTPEKWTFDGIDMSQTIKKQSPSERQFFFVDALRDVLDPQRFDPSLSNRVSSWGIRTHQFKYVEYVTGEQEFYNLSQDPNELESQHKNPIYHDSIVNYQQKLQFLKQIMLQADKQLDEKSKKFDNSDADVLYDDEPH
jgi:arylsulfatase A-like enzyme